MGIYNKLKEFATSATEEEIKKDGFVITEEFMTQSEWQEEAVFVTVNFPDVNSALILWISTLSAIHRFSRGILIAVYQLVGVAFCAGYQAARAEMLRKGPISENEIEALFKPKE